MMERRIENLYVGPDFWAQGEYCLGVLFVHCDVYKNSAGTIKKAKAMFKEVIQEARKMGYDKPIFTYTQNPRFCKVMGGEFHNTFMAEGKTYEVWKWE